MRFPTTATATIKMWHVATEYTKEGGNPGVVSVPVAAGLGSELLFMTVSTWQVIMARVLLMTGTWSVNGL